jgi:non-specific serine/threonine protein kinase
MVGAASNQLGNVARIQREYEAAARYFEEALTVGKALGDFHRIASSLHNLGLVALLREDYGQALELLRESIVACRDVSDRWVAQECLEGFAEVAFAEGNYIRAARLLGTAEALRDSLASHRLAADQAAFDQRVSATRARLGEPEFAAAWAEGQAMTLEQTIEYALTPVEAATLAITRKEKGLLTPREQEVARLIVRGLTNREIASSLTVSERTVDAHVQHILNKLEFHSRAQIASWATERRFKTGDQTDK